MKRVLQAIITIIAMVAFLGIFAEAQTIGLQVILTTSSLAVLALCAKDLDKMGTFNEEEV